MGQGWVTWAFAVLQVGIAVGAWINFVLARRTQRYWHEAFVTQGERIAALEQEMRVLSKAKS